MAGERIRFCIDVLVKEGKGKDIVAYADDPENVKAFAGFFVNSMLDEGLEEATKVVLIGGGAHVHRAGDLPCLMATTEEVFRPIK